MLNGISTEMSLSPPNNYSFLIRTDFLDRFAATSLRLDRLSLEANLNFAVDKRTLPDLFTARMLFAGLLGVKATASVDYQRSLDLIINNLLLINRSLSAGCHYTFNERSRSLTLQKYGFFFHPSTDFLVALEY